MSAKSITPRRSDSKCDMSEQEATAFTTAEGTPQFATAFTTGSKPMRSIANVMASAATKPITWLRESEDANTPIAVAAPASRKLPRYPQNTAPQSGEPSHAVVATTGNVRARPIPMNAQAARNFPTRACVSVTGSVRRSSIVPLRRSSAHEPIVAAGTRRR